MKVWKKGIEKLSRSICVFGVLGIYNFDNRLDMVKTQVILMIIPHPMETPIPMVDHLETLTLRLFPCLNDWIPQVTQVIMDQLVMYQIGVNGLTVLLSVTLVQEQETGIMNTQTEALIVLMTFMKLILAEVS